MSAGKLDPGGLEYTIETKGNFDALEEFLNKVERAKALMKEAQDAAKATRPQKKRTPKSSGGESPATEIEAAAKAQEKLNQVTKQGSKANDQYTVSDRRRRNAQKAYARDWQYLLFLQEKALVAEQKAFRNEKEAFTRAQQQAEAQKQITKILNKKAVAQEMVNIAQERGVNLNEKQELKAAERINKVLHGRKEILENLNELQRRGIKVSDLTQSQIIEAGFASPYTPPPVSEVVKQQQKLQKAMQQAQERAALAAQRIRVKEQEAQTKALKQGVLERTKLEEAERKRIESQQKAIARRVESAVGQEARINQNLAELQRRGIAVSSLSQTQAVKLGLASKYTPPKPPKEVLSFWQRLHKSLTDTNNTANRISFTFRRLFGIMAAFTVARQAIAGFAAMIREMVSFNARIEQAQLGIASLFLAAGNLKDAMGGPVAESERLPLAMKEAQKQMAQLRTDSLRTAATFEQLIATFQVALAPGLKANLGLDQIRELSVRISQAASAIGLAQNQLAEEIRSLLEGTINVRTTRIATALDITDADIKRAKEAGRLFEFLQTRFAAFEKSGDAMLNTFSALWNNLISGIQIALGAGGIEFFQQMKDLIRQMQTLFIVRDELTGILEPNPQAVAFFQHLGSAFADLAKEGQRLGKALSLDELSVLGQIIGNVIRIVGLALGRVIEGTIKGLNVLRKGLTLFINLLRAIPGVSNILNNESLSKTITLVATLVTVFLSLRLALSAVVGLMGASFFAKLAAGFLMVYKHVRMLSLALWGLLPVMTQIKAAQMGSAFLAWGNAVFILNNALAVLLVLLTAVVSFRIGTHISNQLSGIPKAFQMLVAGITEIIATTWGKIIAFLAKLVSNLFTTAFKTLQVMVLRFGASIADIFAKALKNAVPRMFSWIPDAAAMFSSNLNAEADKINLWDGIKKDFKESVADFKGIWNNYADGVVGTFVNVRQALNEETSGPADILRGVLNGLMDDVKSVFSGLSEVVFPTPTPEETKAAQSLLDIFESLPAIIGSSRKGLEGMADVIRSLEDEMANLNLDLAIGQASRGLRGNVADIVRTAMEAQKRIVDTNKELNSEMVQAMAQRNSLLERQRIVDVRISNLPSDEIRGQVQTIVKAYGELREANVALADAEKERDHRTQELESAKTLGDTDAIEKATQALDEQKAIYRDIEARVKSLTESLAAMQDFDGQAVEVAREQIDIAGNLRIVKENIADIEKDTLKVTEQINQLTSARVTLLARQAAVGLEQDNRRLDIEARYADLMSRTRDLARQRTLSSQQAVDLRNLEIQQLQRQAQLEIEALDRRLAEATDEQERIALSRLREESIRNASLEQQKLNTLLEEEVKLLERAQLIESAPILAGAQAKMEQWQQQFTGMETYFQLTLDSMQSAFDGFADLIADTLADAFDPSTNESFRNRFSKFLQSVANEIIKMLTRIAITRALLGLGGFFGMSDGGSVGGAVGMATGGNVGQRARARGMARGGKPPRPRGLSPRDTAGPFYLDPQEWVIRREAVSKYGSAFMDAVNRGLLDPAAAAAITPLKGFAAARVPSGVGRASGGPVASSGTKAASATPKTGMVVQPAIVASPATMETLLQGGMGVLLEQLAANGIVPNR